VWLISIFTMEQHALAGLNVLDLCMPLESNHQGITGRLLRYLVISSQDLGSSEEFWQRLGSCHPPRILGRGLIFSLLASMHKVTAPSSIM
jgi:hypothetical protein